MMHSTKLVGLAALLGALAACSGTSVGAGVPGDGKTASSALAFHAEAAPLKDFAYDTGLVPEGSPAQVQLKLSAGGGIKVDAAADKSDGALVGKPGGKLALDLHVKMSGRLKVDSALKSYDGELPGLKDIDIPITGEVPFDGFLLDDGQSAEAHADLPETTLPEIPLGSIPGSLVLTVSKGSQLTSTLHGTCISVAGGQATYSGSSETSGVLVLKGKIVLKLPAPLNETVDLPDTTVAIPKVKAGLESAPLDVSGVADARTGTCGAASQDAKPPAKSGGSTDPGGMGTDGGTTPVGDNGENGSRFTITVNGQKGTPTRVTTSTDVVDGVHRQFVTLVFKVPGSSEETTVDVTASKVGSGCFATAQGTGTQEVQFNPGDGTYATFWSTPWVGACGLTITTLDDKRMIGSFAGTVKDDIHGRSADLAFSFDAEVK